MRASRAGSPARERRPILQARVFESVLLDHLSDRWSKQTHELRDDLLHDYGTFCDRTLYRALARLVARGVVVAEGATPLERAYRKTASSLSGDDMPEPDTPTTDDTKGDRECPLPTSR